MPPPPRYTVNRHSPILNAGARARAAYHATKNPSETLPPSVLCAVSLLKITLPSLPNALQQIIIKPAILRRCVDPKRNTRRKLEESTPMRRSSFSPFVSNLVHLRTWWGGGETKNIPTLKKSHTSLPTRNPSLFSTLYHFVAYEQGTEDLLRRGTGTPPVPTTLVAVGCCRDPPTAAAGHCANNAAALALLVLLPLRFHRSPSPRHCRSSCRNSLVRLSKANLVVEHAWLTGYFLIKRRSHRPDKGGKITTQSKHLLQSKLDH